MKKTLKKLISLIAVAAIVATSSVVALADNEYMSYSNDFSSATGVTVTDNLNGNSAQKGDIVMAVTDGVLKATRTGFDHQTSGYRTNSAKAVIAFDKAITKGKIQANFDFTLEGSAKQSLLVSFDGYQLDNTGLAILKTGAKLIYPNGTGFSSESYYKEDSSQWIEEGVGYNATVTLDMATAIYTVKIVKIADPSDSKTLTLMVGDHWGSNSKGDITGISFRSRRDIDLGDGVATSSVATVDNLSVDAYSKYNYEIGTVYRSADGLETNKMVDGFNFKGFTLSKLTNFVNPNASFITAAYDGEGRMTNAVASSDSAVGSTPVNADVEGTTVKSFVLDRTNADPLAAAYQLGSYVEPSKTVRKVDFEEDVVVPGQFQAKALTDITTYGVIRRNDWPGVAYEKVAEGDNGALKVERSTFGNDSNKWYYDTTEKVWADSGVAPQNQHFAIKFDKTASSVKVSLKFKFEGTDNSSHTQVIGIEMGGNLVLISRDQDGAGNLRCAYSGTNCSWSDMKDGEWYTFTGEITASGFTCSVAGNFESGYAVKSGSNTKTAGSSDHIQIGSPRDQDIISRDLAEVKTPTSVWYIDDVVVEY